MQHKQLVCFGFGCALAGWLLPSAALATYSIAAVDMMTKEVGGAITSCVGSLDVGIVYGSLPGYGVVHAQAQLDQRGRGKNRALELLMEGMAPSEIIAEITRPDFDQSFASRQYGIVDLSGRAAGFTGQQAQAYKNDQQGMFERFAYSAQGNILTGQEVLDQTVAAFQEPACDLAERLMRALEAGAENGEGDSRCTRDGIPSDSAFIQVDRPGQSEPYLQLSVAGTGPQSPLPQLRTMFDAWRKTHPCASGPAAGNGGGSAMGGASAAGSGGVAATGGAGSQAAAAGATAAGSGAAAVNAGASGQAGVAASSAGAPAAGTGAATALAGTSATSSAGSAAPASSSARGSSGSSAANSGSAGMSTATSGNTATTNNAVEQLPKPASGGGCTLAQQAPQSGSRWFLLSAVVGLALARRARRKRPLSISRRSRGSTR